AAVAGVDARQHLDERRLPRAVLAHEGVDLSPAQEEIDAGKSPHAREALAEVPDLEDGGFRHDGSRSWRGLVSAPGTANRQYLRVAMTSFATSAVKVWSSDLIHLGSFSPARWRRRAL